MLFALRAGPVSNSHERVDRVNDGSPVRTCNVGRQASVPVGTDVGLLEAVIASLLCGGI
jgi:hypothetical protein